MKYRLSEPVIIKENGIYKMACQVFTDDSDYKFVCVLYGNSYKDICEQFNKMNSK